jgi:hypothetical protein
MRNSSEDTDLEEIKSKLSRKDIMYLLKDSGHSDLYPHCSKITHIYLGTPLPDLSEYRKDLRTLYHEFFKTYRKIEKNQTSALNALYVLYKLLQKLGYPVEIDDFKPMTSPNTLRQYDEIWRKVCDILEWEFLSSS